jgi:hypothetical protein
MPQSSIKALRRCMVPLKPRATLGIRNNGWARVTPYYAYSRSYGCDTARPRSLYAPRPGTGFETSNATALWLGVRLGSAGLSTRGRRYGKTVLCIVSTIHNGLLAS